MAEFLKKYNPVFLIPLAGIYFFTRLFLITEIPYYLHMDELQEAYEALCLAVFNTDSTGASSPLFFNGLGNGHSAFLIYLGALALKLKSGGFSLKLFRLIPVAGGFFGLVFTFLFDRLFTGRSKAALTGVLIYVTLPLYFISQRNYSEDFLPLSILPAAMFFLLYGIKRSKIWAYFVSGLVFSLTLFAGRNTLLFIPVFVLLSLIYLFITKTIKPGQAAALCLPVLISLILLVFSSGSRDYIGFSYVITNIRRIRRLFWYDGHDFYGIRVFGAMGFFSVPLLLTGAFISLKRAFDHIKKREFDREGLIWIFIISGFTSLFYENAGLNVSSPLFFALTVLMTEGLIFIGDNLKGAFPVFAAVYILGLSLLCQYYFVNYNSLLNHSTDHSKGILVDKSCGEALKAAMKMYPDRKVTVFSGDFEGRDLLIALYGGASPYEYRAFCNKETSSFGNVSVNPEGDFDLSGATVFVIDQAAYPDLINEFSSQGWGTMYLKEYSVFYIP